MGKFVVDFIDDVLVYSKSMHEHEAHLVIVFDTLRKAELYANPKKTTLCLVEIEYLGHILYVDGIKMDPKKVTMILSWVIPQNETALHSFLDLSGFYRIFIYLYSYITAPMTNLLQDLVPYTWTSIQQESFEAMKQAVSSAPVLKKVDPETTICFGYRCKLHQSRCSS